jgi:hypothetical protein
MIRPFVFLAFVAVAPSDIPNYPRAGPAPALRAIVGSPCYDDCAVRSRPPRLPAMPWGAGPVFAPIAPGSDNGL